MRTIIPQPTSTPILINQGVTVSGQGISGVSEYFRYNRFGKVVIVNIGGIRTTEAFSGRPVTITGLPTPANRCVFELVSDTRSNVQHFTFYNNMGTNTWYCHSNAAGTYYGDFTYITNDP